MIKEAQLPLQPQGPSQPLGQGQANKPRTRPAQHAGDIDLNMSGRKLCHSGPDLSEPDARFLSPSTWSLTNNRSSQTPLSYMVCFYGRGGGGGVNNVSPYDVGLMLPPTGGLNHLTGHAG